MFEQVRRLAEWVGDGKPVTPKQVLRPIDVPGAAQALGITAPARIVTAARVSALHRPWKIALTVGALQITDGRAVAASMSEWFSDDDVLELWLTALAVTFAAGTASEDEIAAAEFARILLTSLADGPASSADFLGRRAFDALDVDDFYLISPFFTAYRGREDPHGAMVDLLVECGAATQRGNRVVATPLGLWAAQEMTARIPEPVGPDLSAAELIVRLTETGDDPWYAAQDWLDGRNPLRAARDLLQAAASATPLQRILAIEIVDALGEPADAAWHEVTAIANLAVHAREALAGLGEPVARGKEDSSWLTVEYAAAALAGHGPDEAWSCVEERLPGREFSSVIREVAGVVHPCATELAEALSAFIAAGEKPTATRVCQLKISLKRMKPPVWRRVQDRRLHRVIQIVMEWDGDHLHTFSAGREHYGDVSYTPEFRDEAALRVIDAFTSDKKIGYTYDFGADWQHDVILERVLDLEADTTYPVCVAGKGDSPNEGSDSFDRDKVNGRLAKLGRHLNLA